MYRIARALPQPLLRRLQAFANRDPLSRRVLAALSRPMRSGARTISSGPAHGMVMDLAGSRPSYLLGTAEPGVVAEVVGLLLPGDIMFDLGANVGYFTLIGAGQVGTRGRVVAYEPMPRNAQALRRNVALNALANVEVVEAAVSDTAGEAALATSTDDQSPSLAIDREGATITVPTVRLDAEIRRVGRPALIKCDIEGAEHDALAASADALGYLPSLVCEVHGDHDRLEDMLVNLGYVVRWLDLSPGAWIAHLVATAPNR